MADIFVSYARAERARVAPLVAALEAQGWSVWWDPEIAPGQEFDRLIYEEIEAAKAVIVVWTPTSVDSRWVRGEAREAADRGILVPVRFENARLPIDARSLHTTDLDRWGESRDSAEFKHLLRALSALLSPLAEGSPERASGDGDASVSIAVLPFVNMSSDPEQEYFSDGLSEELINQLVKIGRLNVTGRTSSFAFKGKTDDLRLVGNRLGVNHVLEGSVRKAGNRLRITAQLINCRDGFHLWSQTYDRQLDDVFAIQDDVAGAVAEALGLAFGLGEAAPAPAATTSLEAYDKYLRAGALLRNVSSSASALPQAVAMLQHVLAIDPDFSPARGALAVRYALMLIFLPETSAQTIEDITETVRQALARAPDHWASHLANAVLAMQRHAWHEADKAFAKARALAPSSESDLFTVQALFFNNVGCTAEAVRASEAARSADPISPLVTTMLQQSLDMMGRTSAAQAEYERTKDFDANEVREHHAVIRLWDSGDAAAIKAQASRYLNAQTVPMPVLNEVYEVFDQPRTALGLIKAAFEDPAYQDATRLGLLSLYAAHFGDDTLALEAARRAFIDAGGIAPLLIWMPVMKAARKTPEFKEIVRDLGLADYWRSSGHWGDFARPLGRDDFEIIG